MGYPRAVIGKHGQEGSGCSARNFEDTLLHILGRADQQFSECLRVSPAALRTPEWAVILPDHLIPVELILLRRELAGSHHPGDRGNSAFVSRVSKPENMCGFSPAPLGATGKPLKLLGFAKIAVLQNHLATLLAQNDC